MNIRHRFSISGFLSAITVRAMTPEPCEYPRKTRDPDPAEPHTHLTLTQTSVWPRPSPPSFETKFPTCMLPALQNTIVVCRMSTTHVKHDGKWDETGRYRHLRSHTRYGPLLLQCDPHPGIESVFPRFCEASPWFHRFVLHLRLPLALNPHVHTQTRKLSIQNIKKKTPQA
jgi:hypothetical protein